VLGSASSRLLGAVATFALFTHYSILQVGSQGTLNIEIWIHLFNSA
jgi:hypothetical protein